MTKKHKVNLKEVGKIKATLFPNITKRTKSLFCLIFLWQVNAIYSQNLNSSSNINNSDYRIEQFHTDEGLPVIRIYDIKQDKDGLIWICSESNLYTFNGVNFESRVDFSSLNFYPDNFLFDNNNNIWLIEAQNIANQKIVSGIKDIRIMAGNNYEEIPAFEYTSADIKKTYNYFQNEDGQIYLSQYGGNFYQFDKELQKLEIPFEETTSIAYADQELIIINTCEDVIFMDSKTKNKVHTIPSENLFAVKKINDKLILEYQNKPIGNRHYSFNLKDKVYTKIETENERLLYKCTVNKLNQLFYLSDEGSFNTYDLNNFKHLDLISDIKEIEKQTIFYSIFNDKDENIWIGTHFGLIRLRFEENKFKSISPQNSVSTRQLISIDDKDLLIFSYSGCFLYNFESNTFSKTSFPELGFSGLLEDDNLIIVDNAQRLMVYDYPSKKLKVKKELSDVYNRWNLSRVKKSLSGDILIQNNKNLFKLNKTLDGFEKFDEISRLYDFTNLLIVDDTTTLCTTNGFHLLDENYKIVDSHLPFYEIQFVHKDLEDQNIFWLSTQKGLVKYNRKTKKEKIYNLSSGLSNSSITAIKEDEFGFIWAPSFAGLNKLNKANDNIIVYFTKDGLSNNEFNNYSEIQFDDGSFGFGGINGLTIIDPKQFCCDTPRLEDEISIYSCKVLRENSLSRVEFNIDSNEILLHDDILEIDFEFAHYNYTEIKSKKFRYKLVEENNNMEIPWTYLTSNKINIGKKPYGKYNFFIQAVDRSNIELSPIKELIINFKTPFYKTGLFFLLTLLGLFWLIYLYSKKRSEKILKDNERLEKEIASRILEIENQNIELEKLNQTKDKIFSILAHDLKSPMITLQNISGKINYLINKNQPERIIEIGQTIEKKVMRLNLFLDNLLNWTLQQKNKLSYRPSTISPYSIFEEVIQLFYDNISDKNLLISNRINDEAICYADSSAIHVIFRNLLYNAIKYSYKDSPIDIVSFPTQDGLCIQVIDKGVGVTDNLLGAFKNKKAIESKTGTEGEEGTGIGLNISRELAEINKGYLKLKKNFPKGTIAEVKLPLVMEESLVKV